MSLHNFGFVTSTIIIILIIKVTSDEFYQVLIVFFFFSLVMQLIKSGKIDETFSTLHKWYPQIVQVHDLKLILKYAVLVKDSSFSFLVCPSKSFLFFLFSLSQ